MNEDIYDKYKRMNFAELRKYLKDQRTLQKLYYALPAAVSVVAILMLCMQGWSTYPAMVDDMSKRAVIRADLTTFGIFDWILTLLLVPLLPYEKTHLKFDFASSILMLAYIVVKLMFGVFNPLNAAVAVYYLFAALHLRIICKRIVFLKSLPDYPFSPAVELERQRELEAQRYSEHSAKNQALIKQAQKKVEGTLEEKMSQLPRRYIDPRLISRGDFGDTEEDYTDKLIGEDLRDGAAAPEFEDIDHDYTEDFSSADKLTIDRRERIEEIDQGFEGDYTTPPASIGRSEIIDEADASRQLELRASEAHADFDDTAEEYHDELYGFVKPPDTSLDEKPENYKPVV